jgi:very-short-patch-repair endonuclease
MTKRRARNLRQNMTETETRLWQALRGRRFEGFKFRRQRAIGPYFADFVCLEKGIVIELDGGQHAEHMEYDRERDAYLRRAGYEVLRFWNSDVTENLDGVLQAIDIALHTGPHPDVNGHRLSRKRERE